MMTEALVVRDKHNVNFDARKAVEYSFFRRAYSSLGK